MLNGISMNLLYGRSVGITRSVNYSFNNCAVLLLVLVLFHDSLERLLDFLFMFVHAYFHYDFVHLLSLSLGLSLLLSLSLCHNLLVIRPQPCLLLLH